MKQLKELLGIFACIVLGVLLAFQGAPLFYLRGLARLQDAKPATWVASNYMPATYIMVPLCVVMTLIWYGNTQRLSSKTIVEASLIDRMRLVWWLFLFVPILGGVACWRFYGRSSSDALLSFVGFLFMDVAFFFWLPTAIGTPGQLCHTPPISEFLRSLVGIDDDRYE